MALEIMVLALIIIVCIAANKFSFKLGIPTLLIFLGLGMLFGTDGVFKIPFENFQFAEQVCSIALIFIIFYGGFGTNWKVARPVIAPSLILSSLGVLLTSILTGLFCHFILHFDLLESFLIGAVIGSTDAASVFSILRGQKLNLKNGTASLLEVESGSNDPFSYMLTIIVLQIIQLGGTSPEETITMLFLQLVIACIVGLFCSFFGIAVLKQIKINTEGMDTIFVLALAMIAYALPLLFGGNGYLSVYICGVVLGNSQIKNKAPLVNFFDGITSLAQMTIFFLLGLLSTPSQMLPILLPALFIFLFMTFIARPLSVFSILTPFRFPFKQQLLVAWSGLRGAASIVFAIMAATSYDTKHDIFHIVFCMCLLSVAFQGTLLPKVAQKLDMIDNESSVLKTFNDYKEDEHLNLIKVKVTPRMSWAQKRLSQIHVPGTLIVLIKRGSQTIVPNGSTVIEVDDLVILSAQSYKDNIEIQLKEIFAHDHESWIGRPLHELDIPEESLVIMIKRGGKTIVPKGNTKIRQDDVLVFSGFDE